MLKHKHKKFSIGFKEDPVSDSMKIHKKFQSVARILGWILLEH